jgi:hypothetical protein
VHGPDELQVTADGPARITGNDILRFADGGFVEYWAGTSTG